MQNLKSFFIGALVIFSVFIIHSCKLDEQLKLSEKERLLNELDSKVAMDFFDPQFIYQRNPNISLRISERGVEHGEMIDSLFNNLIRLELIEPYAEYLVSQIGYPVWAQALVHLESDSLHPTITIPTASTNDTLVRGIITCVLENGNWNSFYVKRDTLYNIIGTVTQNDPNIPGYLLGLIYYDNKVFANRDTALANMYFGNYFNQIQDNEEALVVRSCVVITTTICFSVPCPPNIEMTFTDPEDKIQPREDCYTDCESFTHMYGCGSGNQSGGGGGDSDVGFPIGGSGSGSGGTGSGSGGTGSGSGGTGAGGGGTGGGGAGCGLVPPNLCPRLCETLLNMQNYGLSNINLYNDLIAHLTPDQAAWLLTQPTSTWLTYSAFINSYSNQLLGGFLLQMYINYLKEDRIQHPLNIYQIAALLTPSFGGDKLNSWEYAWLRSNPGLLNDQTISSFLEFISRINFSSFNDIEWARQNISIQIVVTEFLDNNPEDGANAVASSIVHLAANEWLSLPYPPAERDYIIHEYGDWENLGFEDFEAHMAWITEVIFLAKEWEINHPGESLEECFTCIFGIALQAKWNIFKEDFHTVASIVGLFPGAELADFVDGVVYYIDGDNVNASISLVSTLPFIGWVAAGKKEVTIAVKVGDFVKSISAKLGLNGLVDFGYSSALRRMLGLATGDVRQAHHLIPWNLRNNQLVQLAAKGKDNIFHMNHPYNGKIVDAWRNQPNHYQYDIRVQNGLQRIIDVKFGGNIANATPATAAIELKKFDDYLINLLDEFPNSKIDDIVFTYNP